MKPKTGRLKNTYQLLDLDGRVIKCSRCYIRLNLQREFTYGAKIIQRGMKVLDTINTERETEKST